MDEIKIDTDTDVFTLKIEFNQYLESPSKPLLVLSNAIEAFEDVDNKFTQSMSLNRDSSILLQKIEVGSIKVWLAKFVRGTDDEALKELDLKKAIGSYLVKLKYKLLEYLERDNRTDIAELNALQASIVLDAHTEGINKLPGYVDPSRTIIIKSLKTISDSLKQLLDGQKAIYETNNGEIVQIDNSKLLTEEDYNTLATQLNASEIVTRLLYIKKPDYIGSSKWKVIMDGHTIDVKILDNSWLTKFQNRQISVKPKDAIKAKLKIDVSLDDRMNIVQAEYDVLEVIAVIEFNSQQSDLF